MLRAQGVCRLAGGVVEARQALLNKCLADILAAPPPLAAHPALAAFLQPQVPTNEGVQCKFCSLQGQLHLCAREGSGGG